MRFEQSKKEKKILCSCLISEETENLNFTHACCRPIVQEFNDSAMLLFDTSKLGHNRPPNSAIHIGSHTEQHIE